MMDNTRYFIGVTGAVCALLLWAIAHAIFWQWLVPGGAWSIVGAISTGIIVPGLIASLVADWRGRAR